MEALSGLFDAAVCLGEVLSRTEDKDTELSSLSTTVRSISASIGTWVLSLPEGERRDLYDSNPVWSKLIEQMKRCEVVLEKRCAIQDGSASTEETRGVWGRLRSMRRSSTTALQEGFEAISGKYGSLARILRLPEDELEVIREASRQLEKLVPLLNLEMQVQSVCRGRKRSHSDAALSPSRKFIDNTPHSRLSSASTQCSSTCSTVGRTHRETAVPEEDVLVTLALVSEFRPAQVAGLPELVSSELRTGGSVSTTSIGSNGDNRNRRIFGRQEVRDKLPRNLMFPGMNGVSAPMNRFVSRDLFAIEVLPPGEVDQMLPSQDELDLATLKMLGPGPSSFADSSQTLKWNGAAVEPTPSQDELSKALAVVLGLTATGLHVRPSGQSKWCWHANQEEVRVRERDCIAVLLESPPGTGKPAPQRDLEGSRALCILGIEVRPT